MGQIKKVGDNYYIEFYARGLMYSQIAGTTAAQAQELLAQVEAKIASGEALTTVRDIDVAVFVDDFCQFIRQQDSPKTASRFESLTQHFLSFLKETYPTVTKLSQVTPVIVGSYKSFLVKTTSVTMVNFSLLLLRETLEHGIKTGFINDNPTWHVRLLDWKKLTIKETARTRQLKELLAKGATFMKIYRLIKLNDIAKMLYFASLIPLSREDLYN